MIVGRWRVDHRDIQAAAFCLRGDLPHVGDQRFRLLEAAPLRVADGADVHPVHGQLDLSALAGDQDRPRIAHARLVHVVV